MTSGIRSRLWILPPALLAMVALTQPLVVNRYHLNKWKGGGFAMFSTVDHFSNRFLRVYVPTERGEFPAFLSDWNTEKLRIICMPNESLLKKESTRKDSVSWALFEYGRSNMATFLPQAESPERQAMNRVYGKGTSETADSPGVYPAFLLPATKVSGDPPAIKSSGPSRVEAYRLVYLGDGRISSDLISSSEEP